MRRRLRALRRGWKSCALRICAPRCRDLRCPHWSWPATMTGLRRRKRALGLPELSVLHASCACPRRHTHRSFPMRRNSWRPCKTFSPGSPPPRRPQRTRPVSTMDEYSLDRRQLRAAFERAARGYDPAAVLQREVGARLLERLELTTLKPVRILDLGCGTGRQLRALRYRYPAAQIVAADLAFNMLAAA